MSTQFEEIDYAKVLADGGPISLNKQIGYGSFFLTSNTVVFGDSYDMVKVTFANSAGPLQVNPIFLNPQNPIKSDITLNSGLMTLSITSIELSPPTPDTTGNVSLKAHWTDITGNGKENYTGSIAVWTNPPSAV